MRGLRVVVVSCSVLLLSISACGGGEGGGLEDATPVPSRDADGYTAEQREVLDRYEDYLEAMYRRGTDPIAETTEGLLTDSFRKQLLPGETETVEEAGKKRIGDVTFDPREVEVEGDAATIEGCLDLRASYIVDVEADSPKNGSSPIGDLGPRVIKLERDGDDWLVDTPVQVDGDC